MTMSSKKEEMKTDRRGFMKLATVGSVAGGATLLVGGVAQAVEPIRAGKGYAETDHVKTFYKTARF
jgi:predicted phage tail protein